MSRELEIVGLAAADGLVGPRRATAGEGPKHADAHTECLNCGAILHGRYCSQCGQVADDHHRSIFHLLWEAVEGLTHLDGRLGKTLPPLFLNPGALARDHFEGRRQRHVPPFRLFLVALLLFMLALEAVMHHGGGHVTVGALPSAPGAVMIDDGKGHKTNIAMLPAVIAPSLPPLAMPNLREPEAPTTPALPSTDAWAGLQTVPLKADGSPVVSATTEARAKAAGNWFQRQAAKAGANPEYYKAIVFEWAHRLAILLLPIFALQLTGLFFYKRKYFVYDHLVVSMQFLAFVFLISAIAWILPEPARGVAIVIASIWTPINLFMLLRGAYGSGVLGALVKTAYLWTSTCFVFLFMLLGLMALGLQQI